ncbi:MAG: hypothetical protein NC094_10100 [Bacteroidales bacterium]|nr:hypothetical protein [Lachnoclostridium sp.]MCM1383271.1 hypothetical protein [Lachnoclostridium sp.]MCM1465759.1 hypothetical protein [Bacteroidales bacterium]
MTDSEKLDLLLSEVQDLKQHATTMDEKMSNMEDRMSNVESTVTETKLILENEIRVNIQRVAEGHLDLSRNLHHAIKPGAEVETLAIRVGMLESDVRDLKAKLA